MPALFEYAPPWAWAGGCALLALLYFLAWPKRKVEGMRRGPRYFVVRWFHGLVWVLLGVSLSLHAVRDDSSIARTAAKALAVLALVVYAVFVLAAYGPRRATAVDGESATGPRAR
ncbi:MAG TPA: hypothetical protein VMG12_44095 [Polyangiaceae bacterium]|nr:hypothetical protein [Polyangiaceae bacterium]